jgi:hypothetical protein
MNYLNIHTDILRGVEFIGAEPTERATWIALLGWCATQENGGVIDDCKNWKDRQWQQLAGVTVAEVKTMSLLYGFEGENLRLKFYPVESEAAVRAKREKGKLGGRPRIDKSETNPDETKGNNHMVNHMVSGSANHERNEREGKGKKGKEKKPPKSAATDELDKDLLLSLWNAAPERARRRSSRKQVADEWRRIPKQNRPAKSATTKAILSWNKCDDWTKDDGSFIPGLHLWIKNEKWLDLPAAATKTPKRILTKEML